MMGRKEVNTVATSARSVAISRLCLVCERRLRSFFAASPLHVRAGPTSSRHLSGNQEHRGEEEPDSYLRSCSVMPS